MKYRNIIDMHSHTDNSPDADNSATMMCEKACMYGLRALAITDHCECDGYIKNKYNVTLNQSIFEATKARAVFLGELIVVVGVELGQPLQNIIAVEDVLKKPLDFVLASSHNTASTNEDFYLLDYSLPEYEPNKLFREYLEELYKLVQWNKFDSLAHFTYPLRYIMGDYNISFDLKKHMADIEEVLKLLALNNKALEINTSGLRQKINDIIPTFEIVKLFKSVGGEFITIGSDAHKCTDVGSGIVEGMAAASEAGFNKVTLYQNRTQVLIDIA